MPALESMEIIPASAIAALALLLDGFCDPPAIWSRIPHPVSWVGRLIDILERHTNHGTNRGRRWAGLRCWLAIAILAYLAGIAVEWVMGRINPMVAVAVETVVVSILFAMGGLLRHVSRVGDALAIDDEMKTARRELQHIVGRDVATLERSGIARAAIESCAEGFCDGVVAPVFWYCLAGLPGLMLFKSISTADSMIGYQSPRFADFGFVSAKADTLANWLPARLSAVLLSCGAVFAVDYRAGGQAWRMAWRDGLLHRSVNAGWPEAAMGGALGVALAGPRQYQDIVIDDNWLVSEGRRDIGAEEIMRCCTVARAGWFVLLVTLAMVALATSRLTNLGG